MLMEEIFECDTPPQSVPGMTRRITGAYAAKRS